MSTYLPPNKWLLPVKNYEMTFYKFHLPVHSFYEQCKGTHKEGIHDANSLASVNAR